VQPFELNLTGLSEEEAKATMQAVPRNTRALQVIGYKTLGENAANHLAAHFHALDSLNLRSNNIGDDGAKAIAKSLTELTSLDLWDNNIGVDGAKAIAKSLTELTSLNLGGNTIGDDGAKAIAKSLTGLTSLDLWDNNIGDDGAKAIAKSLTELTSLNLGGNNIGVDGAKAIAKSLTGLTSLDLSYNKIGDDGAKAIAKALTRLTRLVLRDNNLTNVPEEALSDINALREWAKLSNTEPLVANTLARAMLIGDPRAGKSAVAGFLTGRTIVSGDDSLTLGIERHKLPLGSLQPIWPEDAEQVPGYGDALDFTLDLWDIGGQKLQHMCHSWFLRAESLYLFVINGTDVEPVDYWIKLLQHHLRGWQVPEGGISILPIINEDAVHPARKSKAYYNKLFGDYSKDDGFNIREPFMLKVSLCDQGRTLECENSQQLLDRIKELVEEREVKTYFEVIDKLRPVLRERDEPTISFNDFTTFIGQQDAFNSSLKRLKDEGKASTLHDLSKVIRQLLGHFGDVASFGKAKTLVLNPEWINKGVYSLFPPLGNNLGFDHEHNFLQKLRSKDAPGRFTRREVYQYWDDIWPTAPQGQEQPLISPLHHPDLLQVLCERSNHLIIEIPKSHPQAEQHYFIPAYLEETQEDTHGALVAHMQEAISNAKACQIIEATDGYWPPYFIYQHMVAMWQPDEDEADNLQNYRHRDDHGGVRLKLDIENTRRDRYRLVDTGNPNLYMEVIFFDNKLYCLGHSPERSTGKLFDAFEALWNSIDFLYRHGVASGLKRLLPCPLCLANIAEIDKRRGWARIVENTLADATKDSIDYDTIIPHSENPYTDGFWCSNCGDKLNAAQVLRPYDIAGTAGHEVEKEYLWDNPVAVRRAAIQLSIYLVLFYNIPISSSNEENGQPGVAYDSSKREVSPQGRPEESTWGKWISGDTAKPQQASIRRWLPFLIDKFSDPIRNWAMMTQGPLDAQQHTKLHDEIIVKAAQSLMKDPIAFLNKDTDLTKIDVSKRIAVFDAILNDESYDLHNFRSAYEHATSFNMENKLKEAREK